MNALPAPVGERIRVVGRMRLFGAEIDSFEVPPGATLLEILERGICAPLPPADRMRISVAIGGVPVPRANWRLVRPRPGMLVEVVVTPGRSGGGGKSPLRLVLTLAVAAFAAWAGPAAILAMGGPALVTAAGTLTTLGTVAAGALTGAIGLVGSLAINALIPPPSAPGLASRGPTSPVSPVYSISGASNQTTPWSPIPAVLGRMRVWWPYGARWYAEATGGRNLVRMLFVLHGKLAVTDHRFGSTPASAFDAGIVVRSGIDGAELGGILTVFANQQPTTPVGVDVAYGEPVTRNTLSNADEAVISFSFPQGIGITSATTGDLIGHTIAFQVSYRPVEGGSWTAETVSWYGRTRSTVTRDHRIVFPTRGQYTILVQRLTAEVSSSAVANPSTWTALRTVRRDSPLRLPAGRTFTTVEILVAASALGNGALETYNSLCTSVVPDWDAASETWIERATRNPASLFRWAAQGPAARRPRPDSRIDLETLQVWHERCQAKGWCFDAVVADRRPLYEMLRNIAAMGRATPGRDSRGRLSVVIDRPQTVKRQLFTPWNTWGVRGERDLKRLPKGLRVRFVNPDADWQPDERIVPADGVTEDQVDDAELLDLTEGCASSELAYDHGRYWYRDRVHRPEQIRFFCDAEHLLARRGELAGLAHDVLLLGLAQGRLKGVTTELDDGDPPQPVAITAVTLPAPVTIEAGKMYGITVRGRGGVVDTRVVTAAPGQQTVLQLEAPVPPGLYRPGDVFAFGEAGRETFDVIVYRWEPGPDESCLVTVQPAGHAVHDDGPIPPWDSGITRPPAAPARAILPPVVVAVRSDESVMALDPGGALRPQISIALAERADPAGLEPTAILVRWGLSADQAGETADLTQSQVVAPDAREVTIGPVIEGERYDIQLIAERAGRRSVPTLISRHQVVGQSSRPPAPTLARAGDALTAPGYQAPIDLAGFRIRSQPGDGVPDWTRATPAHPQAVPVGLPFPLAALGVGQRTVLVRAVDRGGRESETATLVVDVDSPAARNVIWSRDLDAESWPGELVAGEHVDDSLAGGDAEDAFWPAGDAEPFWPAGDATPCWAPQWGSVIYEQLLAIPEDGRLLLSVGLTAPQGYSLAIRPEGSAPFWPELDADPFWPAADEDQVWPGITGAWQPWPGALEVTAGAWQVRLEVGGGPLRPVVTSMAALLDRGDQQELVGSLAVSPGGTEVPLSLSYRSITSVVPVLVADGGSAVSVRVVSMSPPVVECLDGAQQSVSGLVNVSVIGVAA